MKSLSPAVLFVLAFSGATPSYLAQERVDSSRPQTGNTAERLENPDLDPLEDLAPVEPSPGTCPVWTPWLNRDNPGGKGDYETKQAFVKSGKACADPLAVECRRRDGRAEARQRVTCNRSEGARCLNAEQPDGSCPDYEVRFLCRGESPKGDILFGDPIPNIDVILEQNPGGIIIQAHEGQRIEGLRIWIPEEHHAVLLGSSVMPFGWSIAGVEAGGFVNLRGPSSTKFEVGFRLLDNPESFPVCLAISRFRPGKSAQLLGNTVEVPFGGNCKCRTVPCSSVAGYGDSSSVTGRANRKDADQLFGGANPLQGVNVAKSTSCQECECD